jgi:hypothetical protein
LENLVKERHVDYFNNVKILSIFRKLVIALDASKAGQKLRAKSPQNRHSKSRRGRDLPGVISATDGKALSFAVDSLRILE